jgi:hypothetical protein
MTARASAIALLLALLILSCSRGERSCGPSTGSAPVDAALLAFLSRARAAHHIADAQEEHQPQEALKTLLSIVEGPLPGRPDTRPAEVLEVLADTAARVADLESQAEDFEAAVHSVSNALSWVPEPSYFRGHLYEVMGLVEERRSRALTRAGNTAAAEAAKNRALLAFEQSMTIQAEVIRSSSTDAGKWQ